MIIVMAILGYLILGLIAVVSLAFYSWMKQKTDSGDLSIHYYLGASLILLGGAATGCYLTVDIELIRGIASAAQVGFYFFGAMSMLVGYSYKSKKGALENDKQN